MGKDEKKKLGMGLSALLGSNYKLNAGSNTPGNNSIVEIKISEISANKNQPRKSFNASSIEELANSIKENGLIQPIIVRTVDDGKFSIIAGERRFRAATQAGLDSIKCIISNIDDVDTLRHAIIENIHREDLNPVEEALGYRSLIEDFNYTHDQLSQKIGKSRAHITNILRILKLPDFVLDGIADGSISLGHAKILLPFRVDHEYMTELYEKVATEKVSVRELERLIEQKMNSEERSSENKEDCFSADSFIKNDDDGDVMYDALKNVYAPLVKDGVQNASERQDVETSENNTSNDNVSSTTSDNLQVNLDAMSSYIKERTGLKVHIAFKNKENGEISIKFNSFDELREIVNTVFIK